MLKAFTGGGLRMRSTIKILGVKFLKLGQADYLP